MLFMCRLMSVELHLDSNLPSQILVRHSTALPEPGLSLHMPAMHAVTGCFMQTIFSVTRGIR